MADLVMNAYKVQTLTFTNNFENGSKLKLEHKYSYSVNYTQNGICRGELTVDVHDADEPEHFCAKAVVLGFFSFSEKLDRKQIHIGSFKELFPYAKALITTLSANSGVPPIILPAVDIESQSIYSINIEPPKYDK